MRKFRFGFWLAAVTVVSGACCQGLLAQNKFEVVTGKAFESAVPKDFYLEGNAIPTEKRNAILVKTPGGGARGLRADRYHWVCRQHHGQVCGDDDHRGRPLR